MGAADARRRGCDGLLAQSFAVEAGGGHRRRADASAYRRSWSRLDAAFIYQWWAWARHAARTLQCRRADVSGKTVGWAGSVHLWAAFAALYFPTAADRSQSRA